MIGYKGFDKNFCCKDIQYEVGKTFTFPGTIRLYSAGYHFCDTPLAVLEHYQPGISRYAIVNSLGETLHETGHIYCTSKLEVIKELTFSELVEHAQNVCCNSSNNSHSHSVIHCTEDYMCAIAPSHLSVAAVTKECSLAIVRDIGSIACATGNKSTAISEGNWSISTGTYLHNEVIAKKDWSIAAATGHFSRAVAQHKNSVAVSLGDESLVSVNDKRSLAVSWGGSGAKGTLGSWILLSEYDEKTKNIIDCKLFKVDGKVIKPDVYYRLEYGLPIEVSDEMCR